MKYSTIVLALAAAATAATLPNTNSPAAVAARDGTHHDGHTEDEVHSAVARDGTHHHDDHSQHGDNHVAARDGTHHHHDSHSQHGDNHVAARDGTHEDHSEHDGTHHEKRRSSRWRIGGSSRTSSTYRSDATALMNLNVGFLAAGVVGGVGAIFL